MIVAYLLSLIPCFVGIMWVVKEDLHYRKLNLNQLLVITVLSAIPGFNTIAAVTIGLTWILFKIKWIFETDFMRKPRL